MTLPVKRSKADIESIQTVKEAAQLKKMADAAAVFYEAQDAHEASQQAKEISMRLARQAGDLLADVPREQGGYSFHGRMSTTPYQQTIEDAGIGDTTAHNWQKIASIDEEKFEMYLADASYSNWEFSFYSLLKYANVGIYSSDLNEWETPQDLFDILDEEFSFTLDVCASRSNAKCKKHFTEKMNALEQEWEGVCWMNPPYGGAIPHFVAKAKLSADNGATVVCLVPARTDTGWWWDNLLGGEIRFLKGRLKFGDGVNSAPFPSAVVVLGPKVKAKVVWWNIKMR